MTTRHPLVTDSADLRIESFDWGEIQWLCNAALVPGAAQTLGTARILPGKGNPLHYHANCEELLFVLTGEGRHTLDGASIELRTGMTIRIPAGVRHNLTNTGTEPLTYLIAFSSGDRQTVFLE